MTEQTDPKPKREPVSPALLSIVKARGAYAFRDPSGTPYIADGPATVARSSWGAWLSSIWWDARQQPLNENPRKTVIQTLEAHALQGDVVEPVYIRVAPIDGGIAIDTGTNTWDSIVATKDGWSIAPAPVRFRRASSIGALPEPSTHGSLDSLRRLLNLKDDDQQRLVTGFLIGTLHPHGPYPVLGLSGVQGSGKSVTARLIRRIVDPVAETGGNGLKSMTKDEQSFWTAASNAWVPAFDNVSGITPEISDRLCQLATGAGRSARKLYSDGDLFEQSACRPVILNGMELADRPDLLSRTIPIELPRLDERATEQHLMQQFDIAHPVLLGGLLDALVGLLSRIDSLPHVQTDGPRMFDHVRWVTAAEVQLGWPDGSYSALFQSVQDAILAGAADGIVWLDPLNDILDSHGGSWSGGAADLLKALRKIAKDDLGDGERLDGFGWPKSARGMTNSLLRNAETLRSLGIDYRSEYDTHHKSNRHHLRRIVRAAGSAGVAGVAGVVSSVGAPEKEKERGEPTHEMTPATPASPAAELPPPADIYAEIMAGLHPRPDVSTDA